MDEPNDVLALFAQICDDTAAALAATREWGPSGRREGQYAVDLVLDGICVDALVDAGFGVLSEESGIRGDPGSRGIVVVDPLDGSTNASLGLPWCATSLALVVDGQCTVSTVANLVTGRRWWAIRGGGAYCDGDRLGPLEPIDVSQSFVLLSGHLEHHGGWRQYRVLGAGALDLCAVASGSFAAFIDADDAHGVWDYLGGALVLEEAGGVVADAFGRDLLTLDIGERRAPIGATDPALLEALVEFRRRARS